ncbi:MAG: response regulator [Candidatus Koribacter versatilis]|nr:response regulator [Candidatus Koribacter versatilis]
MSTAARMSEGDQHKISEALLLLDQGVLEMIMAQRPLARVLESLCLKIEERSPGLICSVLLLDADGTTLRDGAAPSLPASYRQAMINGVRIGPTAGSCGTAAYRQQPVVVVDIENDLLWADYKHLALAHGLRACWSMPISAQNGAVLGTFACYYREPRSPDAYHLQLIDRATHLAGIALEHHRAKSELRAAETRYRTLVERLPAITYIAEVGVAGRWQFVSPQIESMLGFSAEEWMADPDLWGSRIHKEDREVALAAEKRLEKPGELYKAEYRMHARDGKIVWFRDEATLLEGAPGAKSLMQGVLYDITEYKRLEEQLRQAQKMEAVGQLAGGVAHDFNNLLMVIEAHIDRIRDGLLPDDPLSADAAEVHNAIQRAASLTSQLLAFSRKQLLQPKVLDISSVLNGAARMLARLLAENIELKIEIEPGLARVKVDQGQLEQALLNLAVNARDAMPEGGTLTIQAQGIQFDEGQAWRHCSVQPGAYVMLAVSDTGSGMDTETQARIFEPFFTTKGPGKGTGLGLPMVYGVIKQSGGAISVYSEPGKGTTFKIFLPQCDAEASPDSKEQPPQTEVNGSETILLVEDQVAIREVASVYLMGLGYNVLAAPDGEAALRIAETQQKRIDLVVTDIVMPNMGGRELATHITRLHPQAKVLFMSGYPDFAVRHSEGLSEHAEVLQKPFSLKSLAGKARSLLDNCPVVEP